MNEPVFTSQHVVLLSWAVNGMPSCHMRSGLLSLIYRQGEISCQVFPSQLSVDGFINHAWLHTGEQLTFSWGLRHLWQRASSLLWDPSESALCQKHNWQEHIAEDWCPLSLKFEGTETLAGRMESLLGVGSKVHLREWQQQQGMLNEDV